jgi:iron complex outermembrane receptor protein
VSNAGAQVDWAELTLEELLELEVTSVSRKEEALLRAPSAIAVITADEIRRSGVSSISEALRLVPGLQVASIDGNRWAVASRGVNSLYANKLLVLIDGRSIYASVEAGTLERGSVSGQYGGQLGADTDYRVSSRVFSRRETDGTAAGPALDEWRSGQLTARLDSRLSETDTLTFGGSWLRTKVGQNRLLVHGVLPSQQSPLTEPIDARAFSAFVRWNRTLSPASNIHIHGSFEDSYRYETLIGSDHDVSNLEFQHHVAAGRHDVVWGVGQRLTWDRQQTTFAFGMTPDRKRIGLTNLFAQDEITLVPSLLRATIGSKFEYSTQSGANVQPSVRVSLSPSRRHSDSRATGARAAAVSGSTTPWPRCC